MSNIKLSLLIIALLMSCNLFSQKKKFILEGIICNEKNNPIELATISLNNVLATYSDLKGHYKFENLKKGSYEYRVSYVGYKTIVGKIKIDSSDVKLNLKLKTLELKLETVVVTARQNQFGSKSLIGQDAIRHIQPKSLNDLLQLVPGNMIENPNLNNLGQASIREIESNDNNALGTSVVVDGTPLSNESNMQIISTSKYNKASGMQYDGMSDQTTAGRGIDLRTISAGNIESMEVIRGIPSVEYGNLTSGLIVVKTKSGYTPYEVKFQADANSKLVFAGKGFTLKKGGAMNYSIDWSQSWGDTRKHYLGYNRITATAGYSNQFGPLSFNVKGSFYSNINNRKDDPQFEEQKIHFKNTNVGGRLSLHGSFKKHNSFLSSLDYNLAFQLSHSLDKHDSWVSNPDGLVTTSRESGINIAQIRNVGYTSAYEIDGMPINFYGQIKTNKYFQFNEKDYANLKLGVEYTYDANKGKGFTYDEENPPQAQGSQTLRPRSYKDIPGLSALSAFTSGRFYKAFGSMDAKLDAGVRISNMFIDQTASGGISNFFVAEPRINISFNVLTKENNSLFNHLTLTGGYGISNKMPTMMYLYPDYAYFDNPSLSKYGTEKKDRLGLITTDVVKNTQNSNLKPAHSTKWELGLSFNIKGIRGFATYFNELHKHEFGFSSQLLWQNYYKFEVPATATDPIFNATTSDVLYTMNGITNTANKTLTTEIFTWSMADNNNTTQKHGIEYGLNFGEFKPLRTSLSLNGAWFHIKRFRETTSLKYINSSNKYVGILPSGSGSITDRLNTTFRFITHIPAVKMVFTTSVQVVWYESARSIYEDEDGNARYSLRSYDDKDYFVVDPIGYYDMKGNYTEWTSADINDFNKSNLVSRSQTYAYEKDVIDPWALLSFRFTKEIGEVAEISFIANNFTNTKKWHTNKYSLSKSQLYPDLYFGVEMKVKL